MPWFVDFCLNKSVLGFMNFMQVENFQLDEFYKILFEQGLKIKLMSNCVC